MRRPLSTILVGALLVLCASYVLTWALYWPAFGATRGVQRPLHYNKTYVWPVPWTLHQAAPGAAPPTPLTLYKGDVASQSFRACANNLAMVRVWLAGERGGEQVYVTLSDGQEGDVVYASRFRLEGEGAGRYYSLVFRPIIDSVGHEFTLSLKAVDGTVSARVGYTDRLPGRVRVNEYPLPRDMDVGVYHRGPPGIWTLRVLRERLLPELVRTRVRQYKPVAFKGATFGLLCVALAVGVGALLWVLCPPLPGRHKWALTALVALGGLILAGAIVFRWDVGGMMALGSKVVLSGDVAQADRAKGGETVRDLLAELESAGRKPEPHQVRARFVTMDGVRRAYIAVPTMSQVTYGLRVPFDAELRLGLALPEKATQGLVFLVRVEDDTLWERTLSPEEDGRWHDVKVDLRPYAGRLVHLALVTHSPHTPLKFGGTPAGRALPTAGLWAAPRIVSERIWLLEYPLVERPQYPQIARFGEEIELLGYDLDPDDARPGGKVRVTLYWRALHRVRVDYTVFVHLLDAGGEMRGQQDSQPLDGTYPTDVWPSGGVVRDEYSVPVPADASPGEYRLAVGLYELATMQRLPAYDDRGHALSDGQVDLDSTLVVGR